MDEDLCDILGINKTEIDLENACVPTRVRRTRAEIEADKEAAQQVTIQKLFVDDFVAIKPEDHYPDRKPLIARLVAVDREEEVFEAVWWKKVGTKVGKLLYEFRWTQDLDNPEPNGFCQGSKITICLIKHLAPKFAEKIHFLPGIFALQ